MVDFTWTDMEPKAGMSYYYVRGEQEDGELVWISPVWIHYSRLAVKERRLCLLLASRF